MPLSHLVSYWRAPYHIFANNPAALHENFVIAFFETSIGDFVLHQLMPMGSTLDLTKILIHVYHPSSSQNSGRRV